MTTAWTRQTIGDVCTVVNGGTPKTGVAEYWDGSHQWVTPAEMGKRQNPYIDRSERTITDSGLANSSARPLPAFSVIISSRAPIGHLVINTVPMAFNQGCKGLVPKTGLDCKFLYYFLLHSVPLLESLGTGATFKELSGGKLKDVPIPMPPLVEQKRIVAMLDKAFEEIAKAIANAQRNVSNARELFSRQLAALIHQQDETTQNLQLMDVCLDFGRGKSKHRPRNDPKLYGGPYPFIQTGDLSGARHVVETFTQSYSDFGLAQSKLWPKGTVCIAIVGATIGESGILNFDASFPDSVIGMVANPEMTIPSYIQYLLEASKILIKSKGVGSARENINLGTFERQLFPFPTIERQRSMVELLHHARDCAERLEELQRQKLSMLSELKMSMLAAAFTGQLTSADTVAL